MQAMMTAEHVAEYLRLSSEEVLRLIEGEKLSASKIGGAFRIRQADVDEFLFANSNDPSLRDALFDRVKAIGERVGRQAPQVTSDQLLEELEEADEEQRVAAARGSAASSLTSS